MQVEGTGELGITGACAPRPVTPAGSVGSVCVKVRESRVTLAMAPERKCAPAMTRSAQVCVCMLKARLFYFDFLYRAIYKSALHIWDGLLYSE